MIAFLLGIGAIGQDTVELDRAVKLLYSVISGPPGHKRDWVAFKAMFAADAKLVISVKQADGKHAAIVWTPDDYIARSGPALERDGFFERELWRTTKVYGGIAQVWTAYETRIGSESAKPATRGINSVQFVRVGDAWKIASIVFTDERTAGPLPKRLDG